MSINSDFIIMIGIKCEYNDFKIYKSKASKEYINDLKKGDLDYVKNILFKDYLKDNYNCILDNLGCNHCYFGKIIQRLQLDDMNYGIDHSFSSEDIDEIKKEVIEEFESLNISFKKNNIKLHIFTYFY